jgi:polyferredoxin
MSNNSVKNGESILNKLFRVPLLLGGTRVLNLAILIIMVYFSYHYHGINGIKAADPLMYTNIATFLFWVVWLMLIVISVIFFGRMWCTICPLGWLNGILSMNFFKKEYPKELKNNFLLIVFTFLVLFGSVSLNVHRYPDMTAKLILLFIFIVLVLGVVFKKRVFCRYLCPIGGMLALYGKLGAVELFVKDRELCERCADKQCINGEKKWYKFSLKKAVLMYSRQKDGCPLELTPNDLQNKSDCNLCLNCFEVCPYKNLNVRYKKNLDDIRVRGPQIGNAIFAVVLTGLISSNFFKVFTKLKTALFGPAEFVLSNAGTFSAAMSEFFYALYGSVLLPLFFVSIISYAAFLAVRTDIKTIEGGDVEKELLSVKREEGASSGKISFGAVFTAASFSLVPIVLSAHIVLALVKLNTKLPYFPYIFLDPTGVKSYLSFNVFQSYEQPSMFVALAQMKWIIAAVVVIGFIFSLTAAKKITDTKMQNGERIGTRGFVAFTIALVVMAALYGSTVYNWLFVMGR